MAQDQGMTYRTVGELKQGLQGLPDDAKLTLGQQSQAGDQQEQAIDAMEGVSLRQDGDRVTFGAIQQGGESPSAVQA